LTTKLWVSRRGRTRSRRLEHRSRNVALLISFGFAIAFTLALATESHAAVTVGSDLQGPHDGNNICPPNGCTIVQLETASKGRASPIDGVVVRWRIRSGGLGDGGLYRLRVVRPQPLTAQYLGVATSDGVAITHSTVDTTTFPTRLPIKAGDLLGIDVPQGNSV
jgi:hypothetical protein